MFIDYKGGENLKKDTRELALSNHKENNELQYEEEEEEGIDISEDDFHYFLAIINDQNSKLDEIYKSIHFMSAVSKYPIIANKIFENNVHLFIIEKLKDSKLPIEIIIFCLGILKNVLSIPNKIATLFLTEFPDVLYRLTNTYAIAPLQITSVIFDIFEVIIKPPITLDFFLNYLNLFFLHTTIKNLSEVTPKAFKCLNKLFTLPHSNLQRILIENDFVNNCYRHMNRKSLAFCEACKLLSKMGKFNSFIIEHLPDDFIDLLSDLLRDENEMILKSTLKLCIALSSNQCISELFIKEKSIFKKILRSSKWPFNLQILSLSLLSTLMSNNYIYLEEQLINYGTLDFFVDYLDTGDKLIIEMVLYGINFLLPHFVFNGQYGSETPPFTSVILNSRELVEKLFEISNDPEMPEQIRESACYSFRQCDEIFRAPTQSGD
ncbi:hypothetical protein TRFO_38137 [Tritrichomonas foetus]|uniref:Armadillo repeat-containing domain-containing protein n=1 Tax=Tritrichomonas foetus TaxID=1144522 RepID=A0A1J4JE84_9EUKA|nr:hypothetical protein TRFO_38137 [Tritrichomonas foetus]|eukprot:OHS95749.1 hypothetical protein TRFO_38137 [Tritrichomonas foetus]